jgi:hypothetical protein
LRFSLVVNESKDDEILIKDIFDLKINDERLPKMKKEMRMNDLSDSNEIDKSNEMKMIEKEDLSEFQECAMKNEMSESERMNENTNESSDEKE